MKISRDWLSDFVDWIETDPKVIADTLTRCVGEIDEVVEQGAFMDRCVVGKVLTLEKHPNADKLSVCTVQTDNGMKQVVCGGTNLKQGMLVAFAHIGATVKVHGKETLTLKKVTIRGKESEGMICAAEELELENLFTPEPADGDRPIIDLGKLTAQSSHLRQGYGEQAQLKAGMPIRQALGLTDVVFHIDNHAITNRPDLFSHIGVARELVALGLAKWKMKPEIPTVKFPATPVPFILSNEAKQLVPYYNGCLLQLGEHAKTPDWMRKRLEVTGWRSIDLVVDITNYVLMETGMPLHAFDADDFRGELKIRLTKKGERMTTLDNKQRDLPENAVVISDDGGIFDLFGMMGGLRTSQKDSTKNIFLQAGIIDPATVRRTVMQMGHRTDAATVYEKGVLPWTSDFGIRRAAELFMKFSPGSRISSKIVHWGKAAPTKAITIGTKRIAEFIGTDFPSTRIKKILTNLGCGVRTSGKNIAITLPPWRRDLLHAQDVVEEVARIYGYANVAPVMPDASIVPPDHEIRVHSLRDALTESGATELVNIAFTSPQQCQCWNLDLKDAVEVENPIGEDLSLMRMSLLPALVETAARELKNTRGSHLKMYETGRTFSKKGERNKLALTVVPRGKVTLKDLPLLIVKSDVERALKAAGYDVEVKKVKDGGPIAHGGRSAEILCQDKNIGCMFELHPALIQSLGLPERTAVASLDLDTLLALAPKVTIAEPLPLYPAVSFDESIPPPQKRTYAELKRALKAIDPLLTHLEIVNLYEKDATKIITMRFTYRSPERTLTQEEVEKIHGKVLVELKKE